MLIFIKTVLIFIKNSFNIYNIVYSSFKYIQEFFQADRTRRFKMADF